LEEVVVAPATPETLTGTDPAPKTAPIETKPEVKDDSAKRFAALAKKEKLIFQKTEALKAAEAKQSELLKRLEAMEAKLNEADAVRKSGNPLEALKYFGQDYNRATEFALNQGKPTPEHMIKSIEEKFEQKFKSVEEQQRIEKENAAKAQQEQIAQAIESFKTDLKTYLNENSETYELINFYGAQDMVFDTIEKHFEATQKILGMKEAADLLEKELEEQVEKALATKKLSSKLQTKSTEASPTKGAQPAEPRGLSNNMTSSAPSLLPAKTEEDRIQRALAVLGN